MDTVARVVKIDTDERLVFGWANVAMRPDGASIIDHQDDVVDPGDLERAAYAFTLQFRDMNTLHTPTVRGHLVESFAVTPEKLEKMGLPLDALPIGWWVGFYVEDEESWALVKSGDFSMFSIEGSAIREAL
jgi:hypothetical protein